MRLAIQPELHGSRSKSAAWAWLVHNQKIAADCLLATNVLAETVREATRTRNQWTPVACAETYSALYLQNYGLPILRPAEGRRTIGGDKVRLVGLKRERLVQDRAQQEVAAGHRALHLVRLLKQHAQALLPSNNKIMEKNLSFFVEGPFLFSQVKRRRPS